MTSIAHKGPFAIDTIAAQPETVYDLPPLPRTEVLFAAQHFDASQAEAEAAKRGPLAQGRLVDRPSTADGARGRPLRTEGEAKPGCGEDGRGGGMNVAGRGAGTPGVDLDRGRLFSQHGGGGTCRRGTVGRRPQ